MNFKIFLGNTKKDQFGTKEPIYLEGFKWACGWYWSGGYIGNKNLHTHFDGTFLKTPDIRGHALGNFITPWQDKTDTSIVLGNGSSIWEPLETFLDDIPPHISDNWWRIKDLYKQFYVLKESAEVFHSGGHCTSTGRNPLEINLEMESMINNHIEMVIIPEICKIMER